MSEQPGERQSAAGQRRRSRHRGTSRSCRIAISVDSAERAELERAARSEGLTVSAFVAEKALAGARQSIPVAVGPLREALAELIRATVQIQKVGTNLNQAVAALNATGQAPGNLIQYARYSATVIGRLDQIVARISRHLP
ncbi:MAG: DUF1778 domain-containing protein [Streptosporangiaceae bacterium]|nr:DUF1778 domain-containing protein [Streptosporangiaceae bacterium]